MEKLNGIFDDKLTDYLATNDTSGSQVRKITETIGLLRIIYLMWWIY